MTSVFFQLIQLEGRMCGQLKSSETCFRAQDNCTISETCFRVQDNRVGGCIGDLKHALGYRTLVYKTLEEVIRANDQSKQTLTPQEPVYLSHHSPFHSVPEELKFLQNVKMFQVLKVPRNFLRTVPQNRYLRRNGSQAHETKAAATAAVAVAALLPATLLFFLFSFASSMFQQQPYQQQQEASWSHWIEKEKRSPW